MAHPFAGHRQQSVERNRAAKIIGAGSPKGPGPISAAKKFVRTVGKSSTMKVDGAKSSPRLDRYARGGSVKKGATNVNVIIAPQGGGPAMVPPPPPPMAGPPPPMPPMAGPPGMPQKRGGRAYASGGKVASQLYDGRGRSLDDLDPNGPPVAVKTRKKWAEDRATPQSGPKYARGGSVKEQSMRAGTQVQHTDGKNDQSGLGRGRPITYATGGKIEAFGMGPKLTAGDNGEGRKQKAALQKRSKKP